MLKLLFPMLFMVVMLIAGCAGTARHKTQLLHTGPIFGDTGTIAAGGK
ncbi:MAG: hypothetical protein ACE5G5_04780 [Candidatus Methylomirabilales bacterium]